MGNVYNYVENLCKEKGIKVSQMCADIGIRQSIMSDLKGGRTKELSVATAMKIAEYFSINPLEVMGREASENYYQGYIDGKEEKPAVISDSGLAEITEIFQQLSSDNQSKLLELSRLYLDAQHKSEGTK